MVTQSAPFNVCGAATRGSIRKTILGDHTINNNTELQTRIENGTYHDLDLSPDHFLSLGTDLDVYIADPSHPVTCIHDLHIYLIGEHRE
jgi:hypothetical protein